MSISSQDKKILRKNNLQLLDILAFLSWGLLLLKYSLTGQLKLLIHPNYFGLVYLTSLILLIIGCVKTKQLIQISKSRQKDNNEHITLLPPYLSSGLLLGTAILALMIPPTILSSETAIQRGVSESLPITRSQPQAFRTNIKSEERSIVDWVRTLNAYPEPDAYRGQKAKLNGFVVHLPHLPDNYLLVCRFVITCCAVDASPVGIPVKLDRSRSHYPPDTWLEIEGEMIPENLSINSTNMTEAETGDRQLVLMAKSVQKIPTPSDPYSYSK